MECRLVSITSAHSAPYALREGVVDIGRDSDNDIQLMTDQISRHHARINNLPSICEIEDLESTNGTFVNGDKITTFTLHHGDEIRLGDALLRFEALTSGSVTEGGSGSHDYSDRAQYDTIKMRKHPGADAERGFKQKTERIPRVQPLRPLGPKTD